MGIEIQGVAPLLQVFDMPTSVHFYCDLLGFEIVNHSPCYAQGLFHWAMLHKNGVELMLNTAYDEGERPDLPDPARFASHGDIVFYFGCPNVEEAYRHLLENEIAVEPPKTVKYGGRYEFKVFSIFDPDGYHLCFQWPHE